MQGGGRVSVIVSQSRRALPWDLLAQGAILALGALLFTVSHWFPADMPVIGPYDFAPSIYASIAFPAFWYLRGLTRLAPEVRPDVWRRVSFLVGLALLYAVTQTAYDYVAQRMFFFGRIQHVALHHIGPVLIGLSMAGPVILAGGPEWLRRIAASRIAGRGMAVIQQPLIATFLFVGLFYFWLFPPVHFVAMINPTMYEVMNWTMALDGVLFWAMVLDTRPAPPASAPFGIRAALCVAVMFPQILLGALITFANHDIYPFYAYCGRYLPNISAVSDQTIGGVVIWIPPAMMSAVGLLVVLGNIRRADERRGNARRQRSA
jgi:putative membrane protein